MHPQPATTWRRSAPTCWRACRAPRKALPSKWLYDAAGSALFEAICELPEYYPTRTELTILEQTAPKLAAKIPDGAVLVEFGSGSSRKTRLLLDAVPQLAAYAPIDIAEHVLAAAAAALRRAYPRLEGDAAAWRLHPPHAGCRAGAELDQYRSIRDLRGELRRRLLQDRELRYGSGSTRGVRRSPRTGPNPPHRTATCSAAPCGGATGPPARRCGTPPRRRRLWVHPSPDGRPCPATACQVEEVAVGRPRVAWAGEGGAATQHHLIDHELAVVLAHRTGDRREAGVGGVGAGCPLPNSVVKLAQLRLTVGLGCDRGLPLGFRRQAKPAPTGVGVRLIVADVRYRGVRIERTQPVQAERAPALRPCCASRMEPPTGPSAPRAQPSDSHSEVSRYRRPS